MSEQDQDAIAEVVLAEIESEAHWDEFFAKSQDVLAALSEEALAEHRLGNTVAMVCDEVAIVSELSNEC